MSERFYVNFPLTLGPIGLDGPEAHHLASVSRMRSGDEVCLFNGDGREYGARVIEVKRREVLLEVITVQEPQRELALRLEVAAPLPKGDRAQFLIEKLTELGVQRFVPLICRHSQSHAREVKHDKLERYVIEASKQCGRNRLMEIEHTSKWEEYCTRDDPHEVSLLADLGGTVPLNRVVDMQQTGTGFRIAVGPEGGFTDEEVSLARQHGWKVVSLGTRILRVETAAIFLVAAICASDFSAKP